jgi:hypothetical protein
MLQEIRAGYLFALLATCEILKILRINLGIFDLGLFHLFRSRTYHTQSVLRVWIGSARVGLRYATQVVLLAAILETFLYHLAEGVFPLFYSCAALAFVVSSAFVTMRSVFFPKRFENYLGAIVFPPTKSLRELSENPSFFLRRFCMPSVERVRLQLSAYLDEKSAELLPK